MEERKEFQLDVTGDTGGAKKVNPEVHWSSRGHPR